MINGMIKAHSILRRMLPPALGRRTGDSRADRHDKAGLGASDLPRNACGLQFYSPTTGRRNVGNPLYPATVDDGIYLQRPLPVQAAAALDHVRVRAKVSRAVGLLPASSARWLV
jgi:hypothetical protein